jgi:molybdopterin molybdotransferase
VAVLATGDELVEAGAPLAPGQIHNTNGVALAALAVRAGAEVVLRATVADDRAATEVALAGALDAADVLLVSGGVSVGPHDHVKPALTGLGVEERFWRVQLKPGKPTWFGVRGDKLVLGLPGNPVSALVTFVLFGAPALRALQGAPPLPARRHARFAEPVQRLPDREQAVRVRLEEGPGGTVATPTGAQGSHRLSSMLGAGALAMVPAGEGTETEAQLEPLL